MHMKRYFGLLLPITCVLGRLLCAQQPELHQRPRYLLRAGDILQLQYRLTPEFNQSVTIQPDGYVDINVVGEVTKPGQIEVRDQMSALSAIMLAGGFTNNAKSGQIIVFRKVNDSIAE